MAVTKLYLSSRELQAEEWTGNNQEAIEALCAGRGPEGEAGCKFVLKRARSISPSAGDQTLPQLTHALQVWIGLGWVDVEKGWWVAQVEGEALSRMSPDYVRLYTSTELPDPLKQYHQSYEAAKHRLSRVAVGVEQLAAEMGRIEPNLGRYIQDKLRQLLCTHPEAAMRHGAAENWCSVCFKRLEPGDFQATAREMMAHVVQWCRCDTSKCAVHDGPRQDLPKPMMLVPPIPEAKTEPELAPVEELTPFLPAVIKLEDGEKIELTRWEYEELEKHTRNRMQLSGWQIQGGKIDTTNPKRVIISAEVPGQENFPVGHEVMVEVVTQGHKGNFVKVWWRK